MPFDASTLHPHTIVLAGDPERPTTKKAAEAITPGHLLTFATGSDAGKLKKHATAGGNATPAFALEDFTPDRHVTTEPIDTPYASGESVQWIVAEPGDLVYAWVPASAAAIVEGDFLESNGDGTLRKHTPPAIDETGSSTVTVYTKAIVGVAAEAVDNHSNSSSAVRIRVRVL
jgi:hypothetical protein